MRKGKVAVMLVSLLLAVCFVAWLMENGISPKKARVYQHLTATAKTPCIHGDEIFCSHLPLVLIDTGGEAVRYKTDGGYCTVSIIDNATTNNHLIDEPALVTASQIKIRGNSSATFDKKSYRLGFVESADNPVPVDYKVMGMPAESDWILSAMFMDKALVREYMMYNLSGEIMEDWQPNVRYCEVFLNGEYRGLYLMIEAVKESENRLDLSAGLTGGERETSYLVQRERIGQTNNPLDNYLWYAGYATETQIGVKYPRAATVTERQLDYINRDISAIERVLYGLDYDDSKYGYASLIDINSFVDYWIINEFSHNGDAGNLSTYAHKNVRGKLTMGPVWDFNNAFGLYETLDMDFYLHKFPWYRMLMRDEVFTDRIIKRYRELRKGLMSNERLFQMIDDVAAYLGDAVDRNFQLWGYTFSTQLDYEKYYEKIGLTQDSYEDSVNSLKEYIRLRGQFLDLHIEAIKQFSAESKTKQYN